MRHVDTSALISAIINIETVELRHAVKAHGGVYDFAGMGTKAPKVKYAFAGMATENPVTEVRLLPPNGITLICRDGFCGDTFEVPTASLFAGELSKVTEALPDPS